MCICPDDDENKPSNCRQIIKKYSFNHFVLINYFLLYKHNILYIIVIIVVIIIIIFLINPKCVFSGPIIILI